MCPVLTGTEREKPKVTLATAKNGTCTHPPKGEEKHKIQNVNR